jgi:hypothetical protein
MANAAAKAMAERAARDQNEFQEGSERTNAESSSEGVPSFASRPAAGMDEEGEEGDDTDDEMVRMELYYFNVVEFC